MSSIAPSAHTRRKGLTTDSWITPRWILDRVGPFELDPCACSPQPWPTADHMVTIDEDGLLCLWNGFVWCNPPYGRSLGIWLERMAIHNNGIALVFARTDTRAFHDHVWPVASSLLFLRGRVTFCLPSGESAPLGHNSGGPSVLIGYGSEAKRRLTLCQDLGALCIPSRPAMKQVFIECKHANTVEVSAFIYDQIRCRDCGAYIGRV